MLYVSKRIESCTGDVDSNVKTLFLTVVIEVIGFGIIIPIVPLLFTAPDSSFYILAAGTSIDTGYILLGILVGLYPLAQFVGTPILGQISDRYGRKRILQVSALGTAVASIVFMYGIVEENLLLLFGSRLFNGLTGGLIATAQASIADLSERKDKSKNFGIIGAAFGVGFIFGPFLGGVLSSGSISPLFNLTTPFIFAAALSLLSIVLVQLRLRETAPMEMEGGMEWKKPLRDIQQAYRRTELRTLFGTNFMYFVGFTFFVSFFPVYLVERFGLSQLEIGNIYFYIGVLIIIGQAFLVPRFYSRFTEEGALPYVLGMTGMGILAITVPQILLVALAMVPIFSFSNALTQVGLNTSVSNRAGDGEQGLVLGINQSLRSLGSAFPAILAGFTATLSNSSLPLMVGGGLMLATAAVLSLISN